MNRSRNGYLGLAAAAASGLVMAGLATALTRGAWGYPLLPRVTCLYLAPPFAALGAALLVAASAPPGRPAARRLAAAFAWPLAFAVGTLPWVPLNAFVCSMDLNEAKKFCVYLTPEVERYRVEHGRYPGEISWLLKKQPDLPKLVEKGLQYHVTGASFRFDLVAPDRPFGWYSYDPVGGRWTLTFD